jgi:hypothetical protein
VADDRRAIRERLERARARLDEDRPEAFKFVHEGDEIAGVVTALQVADLGGEYGPTRVLVLDTGTQKRAVWLFHEALSSRLAQLKPKIGDVIAIRYEGLRSAASGRSYHGYRVAADRDEPGFEWETRREQEAPPRQDVPPQRAPSGGWPEERNPFDDDPPF